MTEFRRLRDDFFVAPQLAETDFAAARALGIRTVINNRPDGEAADQLSDLQARAAAAAAGLDYVFAPAPSGGITGEHVAAFRAAVDAHPAPYLAYCRSGTRSCYLWAFHAVRDLPAATVIAAAAGAGYDLAAAGPALEQAQTKGV
jgi:sulfide:quinone oxidoreductase